MSEFSNLINRNRDRPYLSGTTIQYQTVPLSSYTNALNNVMGVSNIFRGIGRSNNNLNENVKIILTNEEFNKLERKKYKDIKKDGEESKCTVCLNKIEDDEEIIHLKCGHYFHINCIEKWLKKCSNKCPICREEVARGVPDFSR